MDIDNIIMIMYMYLFIFEGVVKYFIQVRIFYKNQIRQFDSLEVQEYLSEEFDAYRLYLYYLVYNIE